jgi:hypothetical protein
VTPGGRCWAVVASKWFFFWDACSAVKFKNIKALTNITLFSMMEIVALIYDLIVILNYLLIMHSIGVYLGFCDSCLLWHRGATYSCSRSVPSPQPA